MLSSEMLYRELESDVDDISDTVKCFWHASLNFKERETGFEVLPDGYAEIIFHFGRDCRVLTNKRWQLLPSPFMVGLLNQPMLLHAKNRLDIIGIKCYPWRVFGLLELPSGQDRIHLFEHSFVRLQSALNQWIQAGKIDQALAQIKNYFLDARSRMMPDEMLSRAGAAMRKTGGTLSVSRIAQAAQTTVRTLERKFKESSGYTVRDVSSLIRFEQVRDRLWLYPNSSIADLAFESGYTDQSHLSREFKRYSNTTPAAFARKAAKENQS